MHTVNEQVKLPELQKTMMNYERESAKMDMAGEMSETHTHTQTLLMMTYAYVCTYVCTYMHVDCVAVILVKVSYGVCLLTHYLATLPPSSCSGRHPRLRPGWLR